MLTDGRTMLAEFIRARTTQAKFADQVKCSESHLSLVLKGERGMSLGLAKRISAAAGIPIEALPHKAVRAAQ